MVGSPPTQLLERKQSIVKQDIVSGLRKLLPRKATSKGDPNLEDLDLQVTRYIPVSIDALLKETKFTKAEPQLIYRGFKQDCPTGIVSAEKIKELYAQFFPLGDATLYAEQIFQTMDQDLDGNVNFEEFVVLMSVLSRGTIEQKLQWVFNLYDLNGDGRVTLEEMMDVATSMYEMPGKHTEPPVLEGTAKDHIIRIFAKMELNQDGVFTFEEFREACLNVSQLQVYYRLD